MTDEEIKKLIFVSKANYPAAYSRLNNDDLENQLIAWRLCLEGYTYEQASKGLVAYMRNDKKGFPPAAGQIIEHIQKQESSKELLPSQAWDLVMRGIKNGNYGAEQEYANMPPEVQKAIGSAQYLRDCACDSSFNEGVARGQFERTYSIILERAKYQATLPPSMRIESQERVMIDEKT